MATLRETFRGSWLPDLRCTEPRVLCTPCACPENHAEAFLIKFVEKYVLPTFLPRASYRRFRLTALSSCPWLASRQEVPHIKPLDSTLPHRSVGWRCTGSLHCCWKIPSASRIGCAARATCSRRIDTTCWSLFCAAFRVHIYLEDRFVWMSRAEARGLPSRLIPP